MKILLDDLIHPDVVALLRSHLEGMHEHTPEGHVHALGLGELKAVNVSFWVAWEGGEVLGFGALKELSVKAGEIKSMRTHASHLRKGVGVALLEHIIQTAKLRGYHRLSLETGTGPAFEPAVNLYRKYGFENGQSFADYQDTAFNQFLHLRL